MALKPKVTRYKKWKGITIHHSLSQDGDTLNWRSVRRYHLNKGWTDIGYHFGIEKVRDEVEVLVGRPLHKDGAHCLGHNDDTIGICLIGNFGVYDLGTCMKGKLVELITGLCYSLDIPWDEVMGHKERDENRTCPGDFFNLHEIRNLVREKLEEVDDENL